jgi:two-component system cell cycle response regulator CpdR
MNPARGPSKDGLEGIEAVLPNRAPPAPNARQCGKDMSICPALSLFGNTARKNKQKIPTAAIFTRFLPRTRLDDERREDTPMREPHIPLNSKILLAEDDHDMRRFLGKALQNAGYDVAAFDNGMSAYHRLREEPFELLLTDIVMPEMDGIELAKRATELDPDIKVMFITGFAAVALNPDNNAPPQAKILSKPFHLKDLVNEVQRLLAA